MPAESKSSGRSPFPYFCNSGDTQSAEPVDLESDVADGQQQSVDDEGRAAIEPEHDVVVLCEDD